MLRCYYAFIVLRILLASSLSFGSYKEGLTEQVCALLMTKLTIYASVI